MSLLHFSHGHPLVSIESHSHEIEKEHCSGCGEFVSGSSFGCVECGFYLDKQCAEAPAEMNHPFHRNHNLNLLTRNPYVGRCICDFCGKTCENFVYHCSCNLDFHAKCVDLPAEINHLFHQEHPLFLQFNKDKLHHEHPFILFQRQVSFCDACGTLGNYVPYICTTCNLAVHKNCISVPRIIKFFRHQHNISHTYFIEQREHETWECRVCFEEVNTEHGSYFCSKCNFIVHVNCATKDPLHYYEVDSKETMDSEDVRKQTDFQSQYKNCSQRIHIQIGFQPHGTWLDIELQSGLHK
ncbi:uncharacterized protein LOC108488184 [Gossypium arboreum]|uniref:uncharacterized protein LOC108488184 n=1 Tax=Gossypium arboreum TaxID=29729 RepID=UPI0022F15B0E|nr:uncharacterized protein LOC108488184 [Gossypium arboreum]